MIAFHLRLKSFILIVKTKTNGNETKLFDRDTSENTEFMKVIVPLKVAESV